MAQSMWKFGGLGWRDFGSRVWSEFWKDDLLGRSAQLAYYFLFALFPLLIFLVSLFGILLGTNGELQKDLYSYLNLILPNSAFELIKTVLQEISETGGTNLSFGLLLAVFTASGGIEALMTSLNRIYEFEDKRSFWYRRLLALGLTIILSFLILLSLVLVLAGSEIINLIAANFGFGTLFVVGWLWARWLIILASLLIAFALIYYWSPDAKEPKWLWITPGAIFGLLLWILTSVAFRLYLQHFDSYNKTYGSIGAVIVLMLWLYLTSLAILLGGEINAQIGKADRKQKDTPETAS